MNNIITADYQFVGNENFEHDTFETAEELQKFFSDFYSMEQDIKNITLLNWLVCWQKANDYPQVRTKCQKGSIYIEG